MGFDCTSLFKHGLCYDEDFNKLLNWIDEKLVNVMYEARTVNYMVLSKTQLAELKFLVHFTYIALGFCMHQTTFFNHQIEHTQYI